MRLQRKLFPIFFALLLLACAAAAQIENENFTLAADPGNEPAASPNGRLLPLLPLDNASPIAGEAVTFSWTKLDTAAQYRLEIEEVYGKAFFTAVMPSHTANHGVPPAQIYSSNDLRWRVVALDQKGNTIAQTGWRILLAPSSACEI